MNRTSRLLLVLSAFALVLMTAACSGQDEAASDSTLASGTTTAATSTTAAVDETTTSAPTGSIASESTTTAAADTNVADSTTTTGAPATTTTTTSSTPTTTTTMAPPTTLTAVPITTTTFAGPDGPHVEIGGDIYPFTPDECLVFDGIDAVVTGPGQAPDGTPVYIAFEITDIRINIGTDEFGPLGDEYWVAGASAEDDLEVLVDNFLVTATGTFVDQDGNKQDGLLRADCS